jgi:hypothetical protein
LKGLDSVLDKSDHALAPCLRKTELLDH